MAWTDVAPFGVKGPVLPVDHVEGQRFSIHERSSCWSLDDLEFARRHATKVRSLSLHGPVFDDDVLATLPLGAKTAVHADGRLAARTVEHLSLAFPAIPSWVAMPSTLRWLTLRASDASDDDVRRILSACPERLESLGLRGTPVSDQVLGDLDRFPNLAYVDAVDTRITEVALERFARRRAPGFKCLPVLGSLV